MDVNFSFSEDRKIGNYKSKSNWIKCSTKRAKIGIQKSGFSPLIINGFSKFFFCLIPNFMVHLIKV